MRNILYVILLFTFLFIVSKGIKIDKIPNFNKSSEFDASNNSIDTILIKEQFPFGYNSLKTFTYPMVWSSDPHNYGQLIASEGKEFENINHYYNNINSSETIIQPPVNEIKTYVFGTDKSDDYYFDKLAYSNTENCKFRLPNMRIYDCYYCVRKSEKGTYGNLLLIDPKTSITIVLNIYFNYSGDQNINMRYFYINNNIIYIYKGYCYDEGCSLNETFKISINDEEKLVFKEI